MKITGIAAEYNPFHLGHQYQISHLRQSGSDAIVAVMSGNFVQRGECAISDKFSRAKAAVDCGVDLVIGLPVSYSVASAEKFAEGCVFLLDSLGCVDEINFGSECGDIDLLRAWAEAFLSVTPEEIRDAGAQGESYARALGNVLQNKGLPLLSSPNDILAVEYIKALRKIGSRIVPTTLLRKGAYHPGTGGDGFESAESIRRILRANPNAGLANLMPENSIAVYEQERRREKAPCDMIYLERAILAFLRTVDPSTLSDICGVFEGLEYRICEAALHSSSLDELYSRVKSKRYTMSAVRRAVLACFLQLRAVDSAIPYVQVLAFGKKGTEILKMMKKTCRLPVLHNLTPETAADERFSVFVRQECRAADLFALAEPVCGDGYGEFLHKTTPLQEK